MRFTTIASFLIALILAGLAVYGAQNWLNTERTQFQEAFQRQLASGENPNARTIVVANEQISFGERITKTAVREIEWASEFVPEGSFAKIDDLVVGDTEETARFALTSMTTGEPILADKVTVPGQRAKLSTALTPGMKAISIRVNDVLGVAGFVLPGDRVDVLLTRKQRDGGSYVDVLLQGVKVLAIDQIADDRKDNPSVVRTVTFEVNTKEAQKLVLGANTGTLSLALRNVASTDVENIERITLQDLNDADIAEDLARAKAEELAQQAAENPGDSESLERLDSLEQLLKNLSEGMSAKIEGVEEKINKQEPVIIEKEVIKEVVVEKLVSPPAPVKSTVIVIRNGRQDAYKVEHRAEEGEEGDAATEGELNEGAASQ